MAAGRLFLPGWMPALDNNGAPIPNAKAYFYLNETDTLASVFTDDTLSVPLSNPVLANSSGRFPAIWASDAVTYSYSIDAPYGPAGIPFTGDGLSVSQGVAILVAEAAEAAAADAAASAAAALVSENASEQAYADILAFAASSPEAPSIVNKLNRNGDNADTTILSNLPYLDTATGAVERPAYEKMKDWLNAKDFGVLADGTTNDSPALQLAINAAIASGRPLMLPAGTIRCNTGITVALGNYPAWQTAFSTGLIIMGMGQGVTVIDMQGAGAYWLSIDSTNPHTSTFQAVLGGYVGKLTIRNSNNAVGASGIKVRACFQFLFEDFQIFDMPGTGFKVECTTGDLDGSVQVILNRARIERCDVWCVDAAATGGNNEIGSFALIDSFIQYGGLNEAKTITAITQANPAVVTSTAHGYVNGDMVYLCGITGMTQVDSMIANQAYVVAGATANTFQLTGVNSTAFSPFTAGFALPRDPKSGGVKWKGQQLRIINGGAVLCNNASLYIPGGSGLAQDVILQNYTVENPGGFGVLITGLRNLSADIFHVYSNQSFTAPNYAGWLLDGQTHKVSNIVLEKPCVRATAAETNYVYFKQFGDNADTATNRVRNIDYKQSGFAGHRWVEGFLFDQVVDQSQLVLTASTNIRLAGEEGAYTKGRRSAPVTGTVSSTTGEVVAVPLTTTGINQANALVGGGALANSTTYEVYLYESAVLARWALDINTTARVWDATVGDYVMTGDASRIWKGRIRTDGAGAFITTDMAWLNPDRIAATSTGADTYQWLLPNGQVAIKTTPGLPSSSAAFNFIYDPSFETLVTYDAPSLAAGASTTVDVAVVCNAGDYVKGVRFATGFAGLSAYGNVKAANTVTVTLTNNTAGVIDLASGLLGVRIEKR